MAAAPVVGLNLDWVTPALAVGGAFRTDDIGRLSDCSVSAVIDMRSEACDDAVALRGAGMSFLHLPTADHHALSQADMDDGVAFGAERLGAGGRLLVHCREGVGRSVSLCLCLLVHEGVGPLEAMRMVKAARAWASPSPAQFDAFATWLSRRGVQPPPFEDLATIAYNHLG